MIDKRLLTAATLLGLGLGLASCGQFSGYVADHWPHWAGGLPDDVPPRPGTPGYADFIAHGQASQDPANSAVSQQPAGEATQTSLQKPSTSPPKPAASAAQARTSSPKPPTPAAQAQAAPPPPANAPLEDPSVLKGGGLY